MSKRFAVLGLCLLSAGCGFEYSTLDEFTGSATLNLVEPGGVIRTVKVVPATDLPDVHLDYVAILPVGNPVTGELGVLGQATRGEDMPQVGPLTYTGSHQSFVVQDAGGVLSTLDGVGTVTALFVPSSGTLDAALSGFEGVRTVIDGADIQIDGADVPVALDLDMALTGITVTGNQFTGGTLVLSGDDLIVAQPGAEAVTVAGLFFGPAALELGGTLAVDVSEVLTIQSAFIGAQPIPEPLP